MKLKPALFALFSMCVAAPTVHAASVTLQQGTATFSQSGFEVGLAIDGNVGPLSGWAIHPNVVDQTAVFETSTNVGSGLFTFTLVQSHGSQHTIGRFLLSVTTADRGTFANGASSGGIIGTSWTVLNPLTFTSANGATLTELGDHSILAAVFRRTLTRTS